MWSQPSPYEATGAHHLYRQVSIVTGGTLRVAEAADIVAEFAPVREAWLSWIDPGGFVVEHIDAGPHYERWQVPLTDYGRLVEDGAPVHVERYVGHRVHHDRWHQVENADVGPRIVLVIDRDVLVSPTRTPFARRW